VTRPPILVYAKRDGSRQLVALEWVFTETPAEPRSRGATYHGGVSGKISRLTRASRSSVRRVCVKTLALIPLTSERS